jgi:hypothetical protein
MNKFTSSIHVRPNSIRSNTMTSGYYDPPKMINSIFEKDYLNPSEVAELIAKRYPDLFVSYISGALEEDLYDYREYLDGDVIYSMRDLKVVLPRLNLAYRRLVQGY